MLDRGPMKSAEACRELQSFLHQKIPLSQAMGVQVKLTDDGSFFLTAPLEPNHNHLNTAFGGSLSALATLAGYAFLWVALGDRHAHIVIRDSRMSYQKPVRGELQAVCLPPAQDALDFFLKTFTQRGKARIKLDVIIQEQIETAVSFSGTYVALR